MNPTRKKPHSSSSSSSSTTSHSTIRSKSDLNPSSAISSSSSIKKPNFLKWVPNHKTPSSSSHSLKPSSNPPSRVVNSTLLQVKSLTLSADAVSSITRSSLLNKKNTHYQIQQHNSVEEIKNESREMERKEEIKEKKMITKSKSQRGEGDHEEKRKSLSLLVNGGDGGGRRKSLCDSKIELSDFFSKVGARIMAVDMPPFMQIHAVSCARECYDSLEPKFTSKNLALTLKKDLATNTVEVLVTNPAFKEFDGVYGPAWHCIVGTSFGSFVTHSVGGFLYFFMDHKLYILLFKTTVQKAD